MSAIDAAEKAFEADYPGYLEQTIPFAEFNRKLPGGIWDNICYVPIGTCDRILREWKNRPHAEFTTNEDRIIMSAFSGWQANNRKIVKVDEVTHYKALHKFFTETKICINDLFKKIGTGTYIEVSFDFNKRNMGTDFIGVLLNIEHDAACDRYELRANFLSETIGFAPFALHLLEVESLSRCIDDTLKLTKQGIQKEKQVKVQSIEEGGD